MKGDSDRLVKALIKQRKRCYVTSRHVQIAAAVLRADGVEEALAYVKDLPDSTPSPEAAFEFYLDNQPTTGGRDQVSIVARAIEFLHLRRSND